MTYAAITGWGMYVPERVLSNADLEKMVDTSDEKIVALTGIRERRIAGPGETTATMGTAAARAALERAGIGPEALDLIVVATSSPDQLMPSAACLVQSALGAGRPEGQAEEPDPRVGAGDAFLEQGEFGRGLQPGKLQQF